MPFLCLHVLAGCVLRGVNRLECSGGVLVSDTTRGPAHPLDLAVRSVSPSIYACCTSTCSDPSVSQVLGLQSEQNGPFSLRPTLGGSSWASALGRAQPWVQVAPVRLGRWGEVSDWEAWPTWLGKPLGLGLVSTPSQSQSSSWTLPPRAPLPTDGLLGGEGTQKPPS